MRSNLIRLLAIVLALIGSSSDSRAELLANWNPANEWDNFAPGISVTGDAEMYTVTNSRAEPIRVTSLCSDISISLAPPPGTVGCVYVEWQNADGGWEQIGETEFYVSYEYGIDNMGMEFLIGIEVDDRPSSVGCRILPVEIGAGETGIFRLRHQSLDDPVTVTVGRVAIDDSPGPISGYAETNRRVYQRSGPALQKLSFEITANDYLGADLDPGGPATITLNDNTLPMRSPYPGGFRYFSGEFTDESTFNDLVGTDPVHLSLKVGGSQENFNLGVLCAVPPANSMSSPQAIGWAPVPWETTDGLMLTGALEIDRTRVANSNQLILNWEAVPNTYDYIALTVTDLMTNEEIENVGFSSEFTSHTIQFNPFASAAGGSPENPFLPTSENRGRSTVFISNAVLLEAKLSFGSYPNRVIEANGNPDSKLQLYEACEAEIYLGLFSRFSTQSIRWYDPPVAVGYEYEVISGPGFKEVSLPSGFSDGQYTLEITDNTHSRFGEQISVSGNSADTSFDFSTGNANGAKSFRITGIEPGVGIDPTDPAGFPTGLNFASGDVGEFSMTPIEYEPAIQSVTTNPMGGYDLVWNSIAGASFRVDGSPDGVNWTEGPTVLATSDQGIANVSPPVDADRFFWRVELLPTPAAP